VTYGLFPDLISFNPVPSSLYKRGFKNPRGERPLDSRASLRRAKRAATAGVDALVPAISKKSPKNAIRKLNDWALISG
jgi:hypothetical protein